jgi:neutral ceramidase
MLHAAVASLLLCCVLPASAAGLRAGVARVDITPPKGHAMGGYTERTRGASGTHDPLYATVLLLDSGVTSLALVTCDLRSFVSTRVGEMARQKFGVTNTIISVSHTHAGPVTWEAHTSWYADAENKMVEAIGQARHAMFDAELATASGQVYLGFNRRRVTNGRGQMWWRNAERLPSHPYDPTVNVIRVRDAQQKVRAVLVHFACHPSVLGPANLEYSADYPGAMKRYVESQFPDALCLFVQGGAGDINPYRDKEPGRAASFEAVDVMARELATEVMRALGRVRPIGDSQQPLRIATEIVSVANRWNPQERISVGLSAGIIADRVCFLALPGEPFVEHQITFREKSECPVPLLLGYSYSAGGVWAGYLPTIRAAVEGGYGADYNTTVEVGAGEMLIDRGVVQLMKLRGRLQDLPDPRF